MMALSAISALGFEAARAASFPVILVAMLSSAGIAWGGATVEAQEPIFTPAPARTPDGVFPATIHEGTLLRRDIVPFVGKVFLTNGDGELEQFSCVLTGIERRACVTTAHSFLGSFEPLESHDGVAIAGARVDVTVEFETCAEIYRAETVDLGTTRIDPVTETHRERDVAIITLADPACDRAAPAVLLPKLDRRTAEEWLLPSAGSRVPVTIAAYYLGCTLGFEPLGEQDTCEQYSSTGFIDSIAYLAGEPIYETTSIGTLPGSSGAPGLVIDTGQDARSRHDDTYFWICLNVGHRPGGKNACLALENGSFAREFIEARIAF